MPHFAPKTSLLKGELEFELATDLEYNVRKFKDAKQVYEKACNIGHAMAQFNYALWFLEGNRPGTQKNLNRAKELFEKSAAQGLGIAIFNLARFYENGWGGAKVDDKKAFRLYKQAAEDKSDGWPENNQYKTMMKVGQMYLEGKGTTKNNSEANRWFQKAKKNEPSCLPDNMANMLQMLEQLDPYTSQKASDDNWDRMTFYIDNLNEEDKPKRYSQWRDVLEKFGFGVSIRKVPGSKPDPECHFGEFMNICGGDFTMLSDYEMKNAPLPNPKCENCKRRENEGETFKRCSRCGEKYCSKQCQKLDWKEHKKVCDIIYNQRMC